MDIRTVNALNFKDFVRVFGNVVERCPMIPAAVWSQRPFANPLALETAINEFIDALPESVKEGILRSLPDLAATDLETLSRESREEQTQAGLGALESAERARMAQLNEEYKARFDFPFVLCARLNDKASILRQLSERCQSERSVERARAVEEVKKICRLRLQNILPLNDPNV